MNTQQDSNRVDLHALAREARRMPTPAEKVLWEMVRDHRCGGLHFRRQAIIGPFRVDFYCPAARLAVEVDGSVHQEPAVQKRDADRQEILEQQFGLRFLRLSNEDVLQRPQEAIQRILTAANEQK